MPLYMDVHNLQGLTTVQVDQAHAADLAEQGKYGVKYIKYWFNENHGKAFCLVDAPSPEAAQTVHREAHGQIAQRILEVQPEFAEAFLGGGETDPSGAVLASSGAGNERDSAIRTILFTDIVGSTNEAMGDDAGMALLGISTTQSSGTLWPRRTVLRSSIPETASWRPSCRQWPRFDAQPGFSAPWTSIGRSKQSIRSRFGSAPRQGSPSSVSTISSVRRCNWRRGSVPTRSPIKFWCRTWLPSCASERPCPSKTWEMFS